MKNQASGADLQTHLQTQQHTRLARALDLHRQGQLDDAAALYRAVLKQAPRHADAMQLLGALEGQRGRTEAALELLRGAVALEPDNGRACNNLGRALAQAQQLEEALSVFERVVLLMPGQARALMNCARIQRELGRLEEALATVDRALLLEPDATEALLNRGELLLRLRITDPEQRDAALERFRSALSRRSDASLIRFVLASLGVERTPEVAPPGFVAGLFDQHAEEFDEHLVGKLNYRTPERVGRALLAADPPRNGLVLDLGCGTGLCGPWLRPLARHLVGVDLSPKMLQQARERGGYDELVCGDIVNHLQTQPEAVDIAVAADVFVYVGELAPTFGALRQALRPGGVFVFSVEHLEDEADGAGYRLMPTRRYAHSAAYLQRLAQAHGYAPPQIEQAPLREESGQAVQGLLVVLRRADAA